MGKKLKMGVVGAGVFGGYHSGKCAASDSVDFIGIYDPNKANREKIAAQYEVRAFSSFKELLSEVEAVTLASPAIYHGAQALEALKAGRHLYIEKPLATDLGEAEQITRLAKQKSLVVQVGHQERFVVRAIGLDKIKEKPTRIEAVRFAPPSKRGTDTSVTLDLMTHDLDLVLWLMGKMPSSVKGETQSIFTHKPDAALAYLYYPNCFVRLEASRAEPSSQRIMRLVYPSGQIEIDFNAKILRNNTPFDLNANFVNHPEARDSLGASVNNFVEAVLGGHESLISAGHGLRAMKLALEVDEAN